MEHINSTSANLLEKISNSRESLRQEELELVTAPDLSVFYARLKKIFTYHRSNAHLQDELTIRASLLLNHKAKIVQELDSTFTGEEYYGKFFDLHPLHDMFNNLKGISSKLDYFNFLKDFDNFLTIDRQSKISKEYLEYVTALYDYLVSFVRRATPFFDVENFKSDMISAFEELFSSNQIIGWISTKSNNEDLFCAACQKNYSNASVFKAHFLGKKHIKAAEIMENGVQNDVDNRGTYREKEKNIAAIEFIISKFVEVLSHVKQDTISNVERKMSQPLSERTELDDSEDDAEAHEDIAKRTEEDIEARIYNPLKLPLDWDGKPIPYWLWKLHGLGTEYPCEICGGYVYLGRKAFDRHFQQWRHNHGIKCLGLTYNKQFYGITTIKDALAIADRCKAIARHESFKADTMEEYEDEQGNVFSRKTYEDLKKQGLI